MRFGVIVCPKCKKAKGVNLSFKTTKCIRCNKTLEIKKIKILCKTDSEVELRQKLGLINAELDGNLEEFTNLMKKSQL